MLIILTRSQGLQTGRRGVLLQTCHSVTVIDSLTQIVLRTPGRWSQL